MKPRNRIILSIALVLLMAQGIWIWVQIVDVRKYPVRWVRTEQILFSSERPATESLDLLFSEHPALADLYFGKILGFSWSLEDSSFNFRQAGLQFLEHPDIRELATDVDSVFTPFRPFQSKIERALFRYHKAFPQTPIPSFATGISVFNTQIALEDSLVFIGLDLFLGPDYKHYAGGLFPQYLIKNFRPELMPVNLIKGFLKGEHPLEQERDFLDRMIYEGKILYVASRCLADTPDSLLMGYSSAQWEWARKSQKGIWSFMVDRELLYSTEYKDFPKFFMEAPFTNAIGPESSPLLGSFMGWQIVRSYANNNSGMSLEKLISLDSRDLLQKSGFKP